MAGLAVLVLEIFRRIIGSLVSVRLVVIGSSTACTSKGWCKKCHLRNMGTGKLPAQSPVLILHEN